MAERRRVLGQLGGRFEVILIAEDCVEAWELTTGRRTRPNGRELQFGRCASCHLGVYSWM